MEDTFMKVWVSSTLNGSDYDIKNYVNGTKTEFSDTKKGVDNITEYLNPTILRQAVLIYHAYGGGTKWMNHFIRDKPKKPVENVYDYSTEDRKIILIRYCVFVQTYMG